jgi:tetratricopeptide (TPR) repeat protein
MFSEARRLYSQALDALAQLPQTADHQRRKVDLLLRRVTVSVRADPAERTLARLAEAEDTLNSISVAGPDDLYRKAWSQFLTGRVYHYLNNPPAAIAAYKRAMPIATHADSKALLGLSMGMTGAALISIGRAQEAEPMLGAASQLMDRLAEPIDWLLVCTYYAGSLVGVGRGAEAVDQLEQARAFAKEINTANAMTVTASAACISYLWMQDGPMLLKTGHEVVELATRTSEAVYIFIGASCMAWAEATLGHFETADELRAKARAIAKDRGGRLGFGDWFEANDAMTAVLKGEYDSAIALARQRIAQSEVDAMLYSWAISERAWGLALGYQGDAEGATMHLRESERLLTNVGNQTELAHSLMWRARLARELSMTDLAVKLAKEAHKEYGRIHLEHPLKESAKFLAAFAHEK